MEIKTVARTVGFAVAASLLVVGCSSTTLTQPSGSPSGLTSIGTIPVSPGTPSSSTSRTSSKPSAVAQQASFGQPMTFSDGVVFLASIPKALQKPAGFKTVVSVSNTGSTALVGDAVPVATGAFIGAEGIQCQRFFGVDAKGFNYRSTPVGPLPPGGKRTYKISFECPSGSPGDSIQMTVGSKSGKSEGVLTGTIG